MLLVPAVVLSSAALNCAFVMLRHAADVVVFEHVNRSGFVLVKDLVHDLLLPEENIRKSLNELRKNKVCVHMVPPLAFLREHRPWSTAVVCSHAQMCVCCCNS